MSFNQIFYLNTEIISFSIICLILFVYYIECVLLKNKLNYNLIYYISLFFVLLLILLYNGLSKPIVVLFFNNYFIYNNFIVMIKAAMIIILLFYFLYFYNFIKIIKISFFEYITLILIIIFSLNIIIISNHLFLTFLFLELVNICLYCLIALNKFSNMGIESAFKYFIQSAFVTIIGFFGISLIYLSSGTLFINELHLLMLSSNLNIMSIVGIYLVILTIFFKLGMFPLHNWIGDVYQGSFLITVLFIATIPKIAYLFFFFRLMLDFYNILNLFCSIISLITIFYGTILTLYQTNLRRLLGYGSMVHVGFMTYSISLFGAENLSSCFFYLFIYILLIFFFLTFILFLYDNCDKENLYLIENISQLNVLLNNNKLLTIMFSFMLFSFAGLPIFAGFISKWYIFLNTASVFKFIELLLLLLLSVLGSVYYIRIIRFLFFFEIKDSKSKIYINYKYTDTLFIFIVFLFILNIIVIVFHPFIYLFIFKKALFFFI